MTISNQVHSGNNAAVRMSGKSLDAPAGTNSARQALGAQDVPPGSPSARTKGRGQQKEAPGILLKEVSLILYEADPIGIAFGPNTCEYKPEAETIIPRLKDCSCEADVLRVVIQEFAKWFGPRYVEQEDRYVEPAKRIWQLFRNIACNHVS